MIDFFFHLELAPEIKHFFEEEGTLHKFSKKRTIPYSLVDNNLLMLKSGLLGNTQHFSALSKDKFTVFILPGRLVDHQLILLKEYTACKVIEALRDSEVLATKYEVVQDLMTSHPDLFRAFLNECGQSSRRYMHLPIFLTSAQAEKKAARFFHDMLRTYGADMSQEWLPLPARFKREEIASALYISLVSYDRLLGKWYKEDLIRRKNNNLLINRALVNNINKCALEFVDADKCTVYNNLEKHCGR